MEREGRDETVRGKIFKVGFRGGIEYTRLHDTRRVIEDKVEEKRWKEGMGIREKAGGGKRK